MQDETLSIEHAYRGRMTFKPRFWYPTALGLTALNLVGVGQAAAVAEPWHAGIHAVLGLAFWAWAQRLRQGQRARAGEELPRSEELARFDALELEVGELRRELGEAQERLDFTERLLGRLEPRNREQS
jgi:hypothetical protein